MGRSLSCTPSMPSRGPLEKSASAAISAQANDRAKGRARGWAYSCGPSRSQSWRGTSSPIDGRASACPLVRDGARISGSALDRRPSLHSAAYDTRAPARSTARPQAHAPRARGRRAGGRGREGRRPHAPDTPQPGTRSLRQTGASLSLRPHAAACPDPDGHPQRSREPIPGVQVPGR
jgi:hypothetical protein